MARWVVRWVTRRAVRTRDVGQHRGIQDTGCARGARCDHHHLHRGVLSPKDLLAPHRVLVGLAPVRKPHGVGLVELPEERLGEYQAFRGVPSMYGVDIIEKKEP